MLFPIIATSLAASFIAAIILTRKYKIALIFAYTLLKRKFIKPRTRMLISKTKDKAMLITDIGTFVLPINSATADIINITASDVNGNRIDLLSNACMNYSYTLEEFDLNVPCCSNLMGDNINIDPKTQLKLQI